mmetsp:Transcript_89210/g.249642  ORF Transcript_89210/g.249642 Transcript_89210/m.249642 type:complete len:115 (+) Transcript_89210:390-734(+)
MSRRILSTISGTCNPIMIYRPAKSTIGVCTVEMMTVGAKIRRYRCLDRLPMVGRPCTEKIQPRLPILHQTLTSSFWEISLFKRGQAGYRKGQLSAAFKSSPTLTKPFKELKEVW